METNSLFELFNQDYLNIPVFDLSKLSLEEKSADILKRLFNCLDLTSLNSDDSSNKIESFCEKVVHLNEHYPDIPNVGAVCVYPVFASVLGSKLKGMDVKRAVVSAGFPTSQTFLDVKIEETKKAVFLGADEIDIVISIGEFLEGNYEFVGREIADIKAAIGKDVQLKVILETGALGTSENIWKASILAMEAGADFIKTSTGKGYPGATPEAAWIMNHAMKAFTEKRKRKVGFKAAGGVSTVEDALIYWSIQKQVLGDSWLNNSLFRIGTSRLADTLLKEITGAEKVVYFSHLP
ncbi:MAG: deoxyribose-phosphate aldolase [Bacteroidota bacterium]|jgi:deoxyribose-phosphate aldolase|nr:deoxyribose-phosphate aldolase [Bacteroidota bacterium]HHU00515.1 deoxyribose-phosphate aldolase [Bacteroidales bacterium]